MTGTCRTCGDTLPSDACVCVWCYEWNKKLGDPGCKIIRCLCCQNKAQKILESSKDSNAADIAWSQCEGTNQPTVPCALWYATLEAHLEMMKKYD